MSMATQLRHKIKDNNCLKEHYMGHEVYEISIRNPLDQLTIITLSFNQYVSKDKVSTNKILLIKYTTSASLQNL